MTGSHLSHDEIAGFLAGALTSAESERVELHLDACDACRRLTSEVVRQRQGQTAAAQAPTDLVPVGVVLPAAIGDVIDGRYRVERVLGVGGMGCVFEAHQLHLNHRVALKLMLPTPESGDFRLDRFLREARAVARLHSPHVCKVIDVGMLPNQSPYLVMELLRGENVEERLHREGPFSPILAVRLVRDVLKALDEAHGLGIIHRDLKPANLFLATDNQGHEVIKLLDFGIARSAHPEIEQGLVDKTTASMLIGSPQYMAPEQLVPSGPLDARVDLWAVGCVLYQLLSGRLPFSNENLVDLMYAIQRQPHPPLRSLRPELPRELERIVDQCLAKSPSARYVSARALDAALAQASLEQSRRVRVPRWRWFAGGVAALLALLSAVFAASRPNTRPPEPTPVVAPAPSSPVEPTTLPSPTGTPPPSSPPPPSGPARPIRTSTTTTPKVDPPKRKPAEPQSDPLLDERR